MNNNQNTEQHEEEKNRLYLRLLQAMKNEKVDNKDLEICSTVFMEAHNSSKENVKKQFTKLVEVLFTNIDIKDNDIDKLILKCYKKMLKIMDDTPSQIRRITKKQTIKEAKEIKDYYQAIKWQYEKNTSIENKQKKSKKNKFLSISMRDN